METKADPADTSEARYTHYRNVFGLPATLDFGTGRITVRTSPSLGAVVMPADLGEWVRAHLTRASGGCPPIMCDPVSGRWTALVCPDTGRPDRDLYRKLGRLGVALIGVGLDVDLPTPALAGVEHRGWVVEPCEDAALPPWVVVSAAIGACVVRMALDA
ncbi:DNA-directed RNA polymerase subunit beta [Nocardia panacis]|uniref:DNA-directed RNA polymerase subunit beta n=1 Tax=Nocardia panacis TaxID=2340916 RepID=A0A3A4K7H3_9NOCA|nr:DNA-directed RNA polymerase subunit beta [Nocardia panacis]RJO70667.1 DNA-directed RNA polymerase subunit beta [Nocardia panacis]